MASPTVLSLQNQLQALRKRYNDMMTHRNNNDTGLKDGDLLGIFEKSFTQNWQLPALSQYGRGPVITYGDLSRRIAMTHMLMKACGVKPGEKIVVMGKNTVSWVVTFLSTITYGAVIVPVLAEFNPQDATHIINHSGAAMLFVTESIWEHMSFDDMPRLRVAFSLDDQSLLAEHPSNNKTAEKALKGLAAAFRKRYPQGLQPSDVRYPKMAPDAIAEINYTSGTTGFSKGVMLTHSNLAGNVKFGVDSNLHFPGSRALGFLPLAHCYGAAFDMLTALGAGAHLTVLDKLPTPNLLVKAMAQVRPNLILCVPLILEKIYRKQIMPMLEKALVRNLLSIPGAKRLIYNKIRNKLISAFGGEFSQVIVGGAPLNHEVEEFLHKIRFPFTVGYGMTECGPLISYTYWKEFIPGSSGRTLPRIMESKIISDDPVNIPGEICVRGQNVMKAYYKNPDATADVIDAEGWLHTGDMGTRNPDGTLFIRGRYKTMILTATGQNIYPEGIESKLNIEPYISESLVVERGNNLVALVYPDYEALDRDGISTDRLPAIMEEIRKKLNTRVAPYERIDRIQLRANEFEKTPKRSIKRYLYND